MTFFCAKCQKRHDVREISADMWSICKDRLREQLKSRLKELIDAPGDHSDNREDLYDLYNDILGFILIPEPQLREIPGKYREARINACFSLNSHNIKQLSNLRKEGSVAVGTYTIRLGTLLDLYSRWNEAQYGIDIVPKEWLNMVVFEQQVKVFFTDFGVVDKVTDIENDPFSDDDRMHGFTHICSNCGCVLSRAAGTAEEIVVALAGAPRAGKTACMVAMISSLLNGGCPGIQVIPMAHDDKWNDLSKEIEYYQQGMRVEKTPDRIADVPAHSLKVQLNDRHHTQRVLTIVDMPGEFWQGTYGLTTDFFKQYAGIYENIDCIWFVISKATICLSNVHMIPESVQDDLLNFVSEDVDIIKNSAPHSLSVNLSMLKDQLQRPLPPTMVIVSKPDYSVGELDEEKTRQYKLFPYETTNVPGCNAEDLMQALNSDSSRLYGLNQYPMYEHADNVRQFIDDVCNSFLNSIESNCASHFYASVSPYGHPAADRDDLSSEVPTPYHELYPFLWTMAIHGGLQIYQDCKWLKKNFFGKVISDEHTRELVFFRHHESDRLPPKAGKETQIWEDRALVYDTIRNNLLMNGHKYVPEVVINHERP